MLILLIAAALLFVFINGSNDSSNIVATVISSRALQPRTALAIAAIAVFIAPFIFGVAVARTVGSGLINQGAVTLPMVFAAVLAAILWNLITRWIGIPSSSSHALIGGLLGAAVLANGIGAINPQGLVKVLLGLFVSPILGLLVGFFAMELTVFLCLRASPRVNNLFKRLQVVTLLSLALAHGSNIPQMTMGIITLGLVVSGVQESFNIPMWVVAACAATISLGTGFGGWQLIRTLGGRIYRIRPIHAFTSQAGAAAVILGSALLGSPVSTTHIISSAVMGAGAAERLNKVRWNIAGEMAGTWALTIPLSALFSMLISLLLGQLARIPALAFLHIG